MSSLELNLNFEDETKHISSDYSEQSDSALSSAHKGFDIAVEDGEETYTKAQWKSMSPKERRQLRNKISARNFRTRRKGILYATFCPLSSCFSHRQNF